MTAKTGFFRLFAIAASLAMPAYGASKPEPHLNGGMFYHAGFANIDYENTRLSGTATGLGGRIAFAVSRSLRIGGTGFSTGFEYRSSPGIDGSFVTLKFGGLTADYALIKKPVRVSPGILLGGGGLRHLHIIGTDGGDQKTVLYRESRTAIVMPMLLFEYPLNGSIGLAAMTDWVFGHPIAGGKSFGPRLHIGFLFNR